MKHRSKNKTRFSDGTLMQLHVPVKKIKITNIFAYNAIRKESFSFQKTLGEDSSKFYYLKKNSSCNSKKPENVLERLSLNLS